MKEKYKIIVAVNNGFDIDDISTEAATLSEALLNLGEDLNNVVKITILDCGVEEELPNELDLKQEMIKQIELKMKVLEKISKDPTVYTHYGDDLDNRSAIFALQELAKKLGFLKEDLIVKRIPAGEVVDGGLNIDTGGHNGNKYEGDTIVIDGNPKNGVKSASESLFKMGVYIPKQIVELADSRPNFINPLDTRSGLALARYLDTNKLFELAEKGLLDKTLTDEQLEQYGLGEAHKTQEKIVQAAKEKIENNLYELPNGKKAVMLKEFLKGGSAIAYELGVDYYVSISEHMNTENKEKDGVTFTIASNNTLPENVLEYGEKLVKLYKKTDGKSSDVFVHPNKQLIVAGGPKNPNFKIEGKTVQEMQDTILNILSNERQINANAIGEAGFTASETLVKEAKELGQKLGQELGEQLNGK